MARFSSNDTLTENEIDVILNHLHTLSRSPLYIRNYLLFLLLVDAGLRVGELVKLKFSDFHVSGVTNVALKIRAEVAKLGIARFVPFTKRLKDCLGVYLQEQSVMLTDERNFAFPSHTDPGNPISVRSVQIWLAKLTKRTCGRILSPHNMRHTFATNMLKVSNLRVVQELLGHKHVNSTQQYTHPSCSEMQKAIDKMDYERLRY